MFDTASIYLSRIERYQEEEIPDWAPRSVMKLYRAEESYITRVEKRIGRKLTYGETRKLLYLYRSKGPDTRPTRQRYQEKYIPF